MPAPPSSLQQFFPRSGSRKHAVWVEQLVESDSDEKRKRTRGEKFAIALGGLAIVSLIVGLIFRFIPRLRTVRTFDNKIYEWAFLLAYLLALVPLCVIVNKLIFKHLLGLLSSGTHWKVPYYLGSLNTSLMLAVWALVGNATYSVFINVDGAGGDSNVLKWLQIILLFAVMLCIREFVVRYAVKVVSKSRFMKTTQSLADRLGMFHWLASEAVRVCNAASVQGVRTKGALRKPRPHLHAIFPGKAPPRRNSNPDAPAGATAAAEGAGSSMLTSEMEVTNVTDTNGMPTTSLLPPDAVHAIEAGTVAGGDVAPHAGGGGWQAGDVHAAQPAELTLDGRALSASGHVGYVQPPIMQTASPASVKLTPLQPNNNGNTQGKPDVPKSNAAFTRYVAKSTMATGSPQEALRMQQRKMLMAMGTRFMRRQVIPPEEFDLRLAVDATAARVLGNKLFEKLHEAVGVLSRVEVLQSFARKLRARRRAATEALLADGQRTVGRDSRPASPVGSQPDMNASPGPGSVASSYHRMRGLSIGTAEREGGESDAPPKLVASDLVKLCARMTTDAAMQEEMASRIVQSFDIGLDDALTAVDVGHTAERWFFEFSGLLGGVENRTVVADIFVSIIRFVFWVIFAVTALMLLGFQFSHIFTPTLTLMVATSFALGGSIRMMVDSLTFVLVVHAFDVGDKIKISRDSTAESLIVRQINVMTTTFSSIRGEPVTVPNSLLLLKDIVNLGRSSSASFPMEFIISSKTSYEKLKQFHAAVKAFVRQRPQEWSQEPVNPPLTISSLAPSTKTTTISLWLSSTASWQEWPRIRNAKNDLIMHIRDLFEELGIDYELPTQPVRMLNE